jgi:hypothetical protein
MSDLVGPPVRWSTEVEVDGRAYVFVPDSNTFLALNESATRVWRHCDGTMSRDDLVSELLLVHGGTHSEVSAVVETALRLLASAGLLSSPARRG